MICNIFWEAKNFPFSLYKIGARLLSKARMVQDLLLVSHNERTLLKGPIHAIRFLNKTIFPAALDCFSRHEYKYTNPENLKKFLLTLSI